MELATKAFSLLIANCRDANVPIEAAMLVETFARSLLSVASDLLWRPDVMLASFRSPRWEPWLERSCTILTLSRAGEARNHAALGEHCKTLGLAPADVVQLRNHATTVAVASLVLQGRLPFVESPPDANLN